MNPICPSTSQPFKPIYQQKKLRISSWLTRVTLVTATTLGIVWAPSKVLAEGSFQLELRDGTPNSIPTQSQGLLEYDSTYSNPTTSGITAKNRPIYVDVQAGEVINISACGRTDSDDVEVELYYHPPGTFDEFTSPPPVSSTKVADTGTVARNISCTSPFNGVITNPLVRYNTDTSTGGQGAGTYEVRLFNRSQNGNNGTLSRFDVTLTPNTGTNPDPRLNQGRLWSYIWGYRGSSFAQSFAADTNYYVPVPGGFPGTNYVWRLDLNDFAGFAYEILANELGVDSPNAAGNKVSGLSVPISGNSATPQYKVYLSYPTLNIDPTPTQTPVISNLRFEDNAGINSTFTPDSTPGTQDTGFFRFTTDVDGTYGITIDTDDGNGNGPDGIYGIGDVLLLGTTQSGTETAVEWDGKDNNGNSLPVGNYNARVQVRLGEYHFLATDAETSGGGTQNGLSIFQAFSNTITGNTQVFWDDITGLGNPSGATTTLPNGAASNTAAGKHTWGNFDGEGFGNLRHIDTYVYGSSNSETTPATIETTDTVATDYGDAPNSYGDANHTISSSLFLGSAAPDSEADTQLGGDAGAGADGDDGDGTNDEDGVTFSPALGFPNTVHVVQAGISNDVDVVASAAGTLNAWIDYNQDGDFDDPGEQIFTNQSLSAGNNSLSFNPAVTLLHGPTYARFRFSSQSGLGPTGAATDGEVEDYQVNLAAPVSDINACAVTGLVDGEFELLDITQSTPTPVTSFGSAPTLSRQYNKTDVPGWNFAGTSVPPLDDIEIWQSQHGGGQDPFDAFEGGQHAEINAEEDGTLFQDVVTTPGATMGWQFAHRGRTGTDRMEFRLGPPGATVSQGTFESGNNVNDPNEGWQLFNGSYTVPANQYVTRIEFKAVSTANNNIKTGNFVDAVEFNLPPCIPPYNPNLLLVKRITRVNGNTNTNGGDNLGAYMQVESYAYDDNTIESVTPPDTNKWPNTTGKASSTFLIGGVDGGRTRPNDEIEYTIYFLSAGNIDAVDTKICDKVPDFQTFVPDAFNSVSSGPGGGIGANRGILIEYDGNTFSYSNDADGDIAQYYPPGSTLPSACDGAAAQTEDNGAIVVDLGNLPNATNAGTPITSYGAVRFRAKVK